jgi:hypothetical protein
VCLLHGMDTFFKNGTIRFIYRRGAKRKVVFGF